MTALDSDTTTLLTHVRIAPGISLARLSKMLRSTPKAVELRVVAAEEAGLAERRSHPQHPDVREIHLTKAGKAALDSTP